MSQNQQRVSAVSKETSDLITASYVVPDLVAAIEEAVYNAIDAHARYIKIAVDVAQASFSVTDDGDGIHPDEMCEHVFECAASSKSDTSQKKYGKRGQFLMTLATLAQKVELESRIESHWTSFRKVIQNARIVFNARSKTTRAVKGTYLRVENLFWLLPVRQRDLSANASSRSRITKRLGSLCHSLSMIWPTLSIDVSYADAKAPRVSILGVATCKERLCMSFGDILGREMEYISMEATELSPFTVRGYVAVVRDPGDGSAESLESPGWRQARAYYQFVFLDNAWVDGFQRECCKTINTMAMELEIGIPIFVLKISSTSHEYEIHSDGKTRVANMKRPELLTQTLRGFVRLLQNRVLEADCALAGTTCAAKHANPSIRREADEQEKTGSSSSDVEGELIDHVTHQFQVDHTWFGDLSEAFVLNHYSDSRNDKDYDQRVYSSEEEAVLMYPNEDLQFEEDEGDEEQPEYYFKSDNPANQHTEYKYKHFDHARRREPSQRFESHATLNDDSREGYVDAYYVDETVMATQDTAYRGCSHCASCGDHRASQGGGMMLDSSQHYQYEERAMYAIPTTEYVLYSYPDANHEYFYPTVHPMQHQDHQQHQQPQYRYSQREDQSAGFDTHEPSDYEVESDIAHSSSAPAPPNAAAKQPYQQTHAKQERDLDQLFFGSSVHATKSRSPHPAMMRKLEGQSKAETSAIPTDMAPTTVIQQSQWLSSRRLGRTVRTLDDCEPLTPKTKAEPGTQDQQQKRKTQTRPTSDDHDSDLYAGSHQLSDYFSMEKLLKTHKRPTQRAIASFASKRAALAGTLAPLPGETPSRVRVSKLPTDLHAPSATTMVLDKLLFRHLQVIKQVDRKFILVKAMLPHGGTIPPIEDGETTNEDHTGHVLLLCIDQHAADERVRLEQLERHVLGVNGDERNVETVEQQPPLALSLNERERETLLFFKDEIQAWGFEVEVEADTRMPAWLTHTPMIDKRVANGDDLREYLQLLSNSDPRVARCVLRPPVITRLLHSRACRSAIMFGDYLSLSQCRDIVEMLSQCQLPFQCAHGRPSIVPLVELI